MATALCASGLGSCAHSAPSGVPAGFSPAPEVLLRPCDGPQLLTDSSHELGLSAAEAARLWGQDRFALARCASRHRVLSAHVRRQQGSQ
jgi:hypothetical protein